MYHRRRFIVSSLLLVLLAIGVSQNTLQAADDLRADAINAMRKAGAYYREKVASHGGYVYYYSTDLQQRWGEGVATVDQIFVQPPGTPTVGAAFLNAYVATGEREFLDAAVAAGEALAHGQLKSGGWTQTVDFAPRGKGKNNSTLDDGITQSAISFLTYLDYKLDFKNERIHDTAKTALDALLAAQFPNGGFPQVWTGPVTPQPVVSPSYPDYDWRTEGKIKNYWDMYTLNDNVASNVTSALIAAYQVYKDDRYKQALAKLGDFLVLAQMPDPQPAWCQQYGYDMRPIWARRFEPAAVSGRESQDAMDALMRIYGMTGEKKYLAPIPKAIAYLRRSKLPDGRLARYYELQTNKPLYMTRKGDNYTLTHDDSDLPDHYGWKTESRLDEIEREYEHLLADSGVAVAVTGVAGAVTDGNHEEELRKIINSLDSLGRWVSTYQGEMIVGQPKWKQGFQYIGSDVFSNNMNRLADYVNSTK